MPSRQSILKKPSSSLPLSLMALLSVGITSCQDLPTNPTEAQVRRSVHGAFGAAPADAFVDVEAAGANDGTSWTDAYVDLQDALENAIDIGGDGAISIWIADGTYKPSKVYSPDGVEGGRYGEDGRAAGGGTLADYEAARDAGLLDTFYLKGTTRLYGGFRGLSGGGSAHIRDGTTILSGDLGGNDDIDWAPFWDPTADSESYRESRADNVRHVTRSGNDIPGPGLGGGPILMDGLTIEGGDAVYTISETGSAVGLPRQRYRNGGGLYAVRNDVTLNDVVVQRNESFWTGGGVTNDAVVLPGINSLIATHSTFRDNHSFFGGALEALAGASLELVGNSFESNTARISGGGLRVIRLESVVVSDNSFANNNAQAGGGVSFNRVESGAVSDNSFTGNSAGFGGGLQIERESIVVVSDNSFTDNSAVGFSSGASGGDGGAISFQVNTVLNLSKNDLSNNSAVANGGAVSAVGGTVTAFKDHYNFNTAGGNGGALSLIGVTGDLAQQHFNHNHADGLGDSMYLQASTLDLSKIKIAGEDGDDVASLVGISSPPVLLRRPSGAAGAIEPGEAPRVSPEELGNRCEDESSQEAGTLGCSIDGLDRFMTFHLDESP